MAMMPNRRPGQTPPIFDRTKMQLPGQPVPPIYGQGGGASGGAGQPHGRTEGQGGTGGRDIPVPGSSGYHGYGIAGMFQNLGKQAGVGSVVPTGGFGFDRFQKTALNPYMQQLGDLMPGNNYQLDMSGGIARALQSLGINTQLVQHQGGFGIGGDQRAAFLNSLQDLVNGLNAQQGPANPPANRHPHPMPAEPVPPYYYSPGHRHGA